MIAVRDPQDDVRSAERCIQRRRSRPRQWTVIRRAESRRDRRIRWPLHKRRANETEIRDVLRRAWGAATLWSGCHGLRSCKPLDRLSRPTDRRSAGRPPASVPRANRRTPREPTPDPGGRAAGRPGRSSGGGQSAAAPCWAANRLQPAADRSFVRHVLRGKPRFQVAFFSRDDHQRHERNGWREGNQQTETVDPKRESELEDREGEIDGVPAEAVEPRAYDRRRGAIPWDGRARCPQRVNCRNEEGNGCERDNGADRRADGGWDQARRPHDVNHQSENDRAQVDETGTGKPEVRDVGHLGTSVASRIAYHPVSFRVAQRSR